MHFRFSPWIKIYLGARYFSSQVLGINFLFLFVPFLLDKVTFIISNFLNYPWWTWWYTARIFFQERKTDFILLGLLQVDRPQQSESLGRAPTEVLPHPMRHSLPWGGTNLMTDLHSPTHSSTTASVQSWLPSFHSKDVELP